MPCSSGMDSPSLENYAEYREIKNEVDKVTRILCNILTTLEEHEVSFDFSSETEDWWKEHKELDRIRQEKERIEKEREQERLKKLMKEQREKRIRNKEKRRQEYEKLKKEFGE